MNNIYNKIFFVLAALFYGQTIEAYAYRIYNNTDVDIKVSCYSVGPSQEVSCYSVGPSQSAIIDKGTDHLFSFPGDECMSAFDLSDVNYSYGQERITGVCRSQDYDVRIKKNKDGNPETHTTIVEHRLDEKEILKTIKFFDIVEINK